MRQPWAEADTEDLTRKLECEASLSGLGLSLGTSLPPGHNFSNKATFMEVGLGECNTQ